MSSSKLFVIEVCSGHIYHLGVILGILNDIVKQFGRIITQTSLGLGPFILRSIKILYLCNSPYTFLYTIWGTMEPWTTVWLFIYNTTYRYKYYNTKINMTPPGKSSYPFLIQQNIHWMQHPKVATYPEVTTFSCNQTELTTKVGICCNFFSETFTQWLQLFA